MIYSFSHAPLPILQPPYQSLVNLQAGNRKKVLEDSYRLQRFLADYRDLISWTNDTKSIIQADELAKDVAGAEALLERHQEHKGSVVA